MNTTSDGRDAWISLPAGLERRLAAFRVRVWRIKLFEAACCALAGPGQCGWRSLPPRSRPAG